MTNDYRMSMVLDNQHDRATLSATSERSGAHIDNTQRNERNRVWRSIDTSEQVIEAQMAVGAYADTLAIINHNLTSSGLVKIQLFSGKNIVHDTGPVSAGEIIPAGVWRAGIDSWGSSYGDSLRESGRSLRFGSVAFDSYKITINDSLNPDESIEIGRIVLGLSFRPNYNMSYGVDMTWVDSATHEYSAGKTLRTINGGSPRRRVSFSLSWLEASDRERLIPELAEIGMIRDIYVDLYPAESGISRLSAQFMGRMDSGYGDAHKSFGNYASTITILEV